MKQIISKKDLTYIIIFLVMVNLVIFTRNFYQNQKVFEAIGFLSSVVSIILSVLAIIYTFFQNFHSSTAIEQINSASKNLSEISTKIKDAMSSFEKVSDNLNSDLEIKFSGVKKDFGDITRDLINDIYKKTSEERKEPVHIIKADHKNIILNLINYNKNYTLKNVLIEIDKFSKKELITITDLIIIINSLNIFNEAEKDVNAEINLGYFFFLMDGYIKHIRYL
ncbi:hypothetical protein [Leptospira biflexa]|uniref:Uncharacterized protein n=1 Tax=Leptospira biflexa serovar Patoc (strain Patoc 1 / ATCC 23582 / Paris) TaxID=456481 RepID=B0ST35_LEPBP|nr:hypothetical protein [Leptospira biflexa]ABZ98275.1 Conserved hypothetical protein [Leptospira biflexa serovar Patoc strain 'Patoc 1 (Paris)']